MSATLEAFSSEIAAIVARAEASIVSVQSRRSLASGFMWKKGLIVTSDEALPEDGDLTVTLRGGQAVPARRAGRDPTTDIALLRVEAADAAPPAALSKTTPKTGELAVAVAARGGQAHAALGMITHAGPAWRSLRGGEIDARIDLGLGLRRSSEGALVFNAAGAAIGMAVAGPRRRALVIPSTTIERVAATLEAHGAVARGYLGLGLQPVRLGSGGVGAMVMSVDPDGPGAAAGLRQGDIITTWNGEALRGVQMLLRGLGPASVGTRATLAVSRGGAPLDFEIDIGERPEV